MGSSSPSPLFLIFHLLCDCTWEREQLLARWQPLCTYHTVSVLGAEVWICTLYIVADGQEYRVMYFSPFLLHSKYVVVYMKCHDSRQWHKPGRVHLHMEMEFLPVLIEETQNFHFSSQTTEFACSLFIRQEKLRERSQKFIPTCVGRSSLIWQRWKFMLPDEPGLADPVGLARCCCWVALACELFCFFPHNTTEKFFVSFCSPCCLFLSKQY